MIKDDIDAITLEYFLNKSKFEKKLADLGVAAARPDLRERKFYRRRIIQMVKDLFKNDAPNAAIRSSFDGLTRECISYFKFEDTHAGLQTEYEGLEGESEIPSPPAELENPDELLFNNTPNTVTLDSFVVSSKPSIETRPLPTVKEVKLFSKELKMKGVKRNRKVKDKEE
jgi:hypothetical protein